MESGSTLAGEAWLNYTLNVCRSVLAGGIKFHGGGCASHPRLTPYMRAELALMGKEALMRAAFENQSAWWAKPGQKVGEHVEQLAADGTVSALDFKAVEGADKVPPNLAEPSLIDTRQEVAKLAGVSHGTISKVERIQKSAAPAVVEAVRKGEVSIDAAAQVAALPVEEQEAIAAKGPQAIKRTAAEQRAKRIANRVACVRRGILNRIQWC